MDTSRRNVLKVIGASGLTVALPSIAPAFASQYSEPGAPPLPLHLVLDEKMADSGFLAGAQAARMARQARVPLTQMSSDLSLGYVSALDALLQSGEPARVMGLVDDANAAIIVGLARAVQARMHWMAQHTGGPDSTRHTVLVAASDLCCEQLGRQLPSTDAPSWLADKWPAQLGYVLTRLDSSPATHYTLAGVPATPHAGSFVSFSFDTQGARHG